MEKHETSAGQPGSATSLYLFIHVYDDYRTAGCSSVFRSHATSTRAPASLSPWADRTRSHACTTPNEVTRHLTSFAAATVAPHAAAFVSSLACSHATTCVVPPGQRCWGARGNASAKSGSTNAEESARRRVGDSHRARGPLTWEGGHEERRGEASGKGSA